MPVLVEHGYRVLVWDLRGHGRSRPMGTPFSVPEAADDLQAILDRIGNRTAIHCGLSAGGFVVQWLARIRPERARAIAVIGAGPVTDAHPRWMWWALRAWPWFLRALPWGLMRRLLVASSADRPVTRAYLHEVFDSSARATCSRSSPADWRAWLRRFRYGPVEWLWRSLTYGKRQPLRVP